MWCEGFVESVGLEPGVQSEKEKERWMVKLVMMMMNWCI